MNIGTMVDGRYRIDEEIGNGGMATVYKAFDTIDKRFVALKAIKKEFCVEPNYVRRFEHEANAVLTLHNKNIAEAYDFGSFEGQSYIILEYVCGSTLKDSLREHGAVSPKIAVKIACSILDALECAHSAGYIHRDVKPQNVLISEDKTVKLTDFGIAKDAESSTRTYDGQNIVGSVHYISPEQAKGEPVSNKSDLYSVGIILYEMLIGSPPFDGDNIVNLALKHINEQITPPMDINPAIPPALSDVVIKATAKSPKDRFDSAAEMKQALIRTLSHPNRRIKSVMDINKQEHSSRGYGKARVWHIVLPVTIAVALVVGIILLWYFLIYKEAVNDQLTTVPNLIGKTEENAKELAENREFKLEIVGSVPSDEYPAGQVCWQSIPAGTNKEKDTIIDVKISSGSETFEMINILGMTIEEASRSLAKIGMFIESVTYSQSDAEPGTITRQSIEAGNEVIEGDGVAIEVSGVYGVTSIAMPNLAEAGSLKDVFNLMRLYELTNYRIIYVDKPIGSVVGNVVSQTPSAKSAVIPSQTYVELYVYFDFDDAPTANFKNILVLKEDNTHITVALESDLGEVILYQTVLNSGENTIEFTAPYIEAGEYTCVIYANDTEIIRFIKIFSK